MGRQLTITRNEIRAGVAQWLKAAKESPADASSPAAGAASGLIKMQVDLTETKADLAIERGGRGPRGTLPMHHPAISRRYLGDISQAAARDDAQTLAAERFPAAQYIECAQYGSAARCETRMASTYL